MSERARLIALLSRYDVDNGMPPAIADEILAAGYVRLPAEGSPEEAAMVERMLKAYDDEFNQTNMAYRRPMRAALRSLRTGGGNG